MALTVEQMKKNGEEFLQKERQKDVDALNRSRAEMSKIIYRLQKRGLLLAAQEASTLKLLFAQECSRLWAGEEKR